MAGDAARRIILALIFGAISAVAAAAFDATYVRLNADRIVIFAGAERFVLKRDAAWQLADPKQKPKYDKWRDKLALPSDPGILVATLPSAKEIPYLGEIRVANAGEGKQVTFDLTTGSKSVKLMAVQGGWRPDDAGKKVYADLAKLLKTSPSTLSVNLANSGDAMSEAQAWSKFLDRFKAPEFFVVVGKEGVLWGISGNAAPVDPQPENRPSTTVTTGGSSARPQTPAKAEGGVPGWILGVLGTSVAANLALLFLLMQSRKTPEDRLEVSHHERQLVEKARDEQKRAKIDSRSAVGAEEAVIGKMIEAYDHYDRINAERLELQTYRQFKEDFDKFDKQAKQIKQQSDERQKMVQELTATLRSEQSRQADLQKELNRAKDTIASLESELRDAEKLLDDIGFWQRDFTLRLQQMTAEMRNE